MKKIQKFFFPSIAALILVSVLFYDEASMLKQEKLGFHVLESDELFFKNLRQYYYDREYRADAKVDLFRFSKRQNRGQAPALNFTIVSNWLHDQAYILPEPIGVVDSLNYRVAVVNDDSTTFALGLTNHTENLNFAFQIYQAVLLEDSRVYLETRKGMEPVLEDRSKKMAVKQVLKDYFKLTGAL